MSQKISEEELIKGCLAGTWAFQQMLYKQYAAKMLTVCMRYTSKREEAEDILQEGFVLVFEKMAQFKKKGSFEGWIRKIMVNKAIEHYRKSVHVYPVMSIEDKENEAVSTEDILSNINATELLKMIQELPPMYKMVFNLYVFEEMTHKEIAEQLGIAEGTSKSNLSDARGILKRKINNNMLRAERYEFNEQKAY
ncbi:MAG TPA: sigma-70 family RNA polymerase sigma factor [Bacteroidia bacterium]|jgi:RNA polymerase sigma-70 factor (ECF subfamily)|nr:sigma-70 family RNA polymerase sigma factor [Bacteroidia bacterium]